MAQRHQADGRDLRRIPGGIRRTTLVRVVVHAIEGDVALAVRCPCHHEGSLAAYLGRYTGWRRRSGTVVRYRHALKRIGALVGRDIYGRIVDSEIFSDGFESGNTNGW